MITHWRESGYSLQKKDKEEDRQMRRTLLGSDFSLGRQQFLLHSSAPMGQTTLMLVIFIPAI